LIPLADRCRKPRIGGRNRELSLHFSLVAGKWLDFAAAQPISRPRKRVALAASARLNFLVATLQMPSLMHP